MSIWDKWRDIYGTESVDPTKSLKSSNPSEYGYIYSAERPKPPPEVGWKDRQSAEDQKVNLYSENVVKEGDTTEAVDRESIANLSTTKRQWETIFTTQTSSPGESTLKKKGTPKWEVRLPYTEKRSAPPVEAANHENSQEHNGASNDSEEEPAMFKKPVDTESAIEREIRLANEREEVLRKEKEERMKQMEKQQKSQQQKSQGQQIIASYEAVSAESESCQPAYNELTEADRGPDLWGVEAGARKEEDDSESDSSAAEDVNPNESIIEREIRLQRERDEEIARMRKQSASAQQQQQIQPQQQQQVSAPPPEPVYSEPEEEEDVNHNQMKGVAYEDSISKSSHEGESLIARELRELKEREEEIRRLHSNLQGTHITDDVDGQVTSQKPSTLNVTAGAQKPQQSSPSPAQGGTWQRDVSPFVSQNRKGSVDSTSSHSTGRTPSDATPSRRDVRVQPISDGRDDDEDAKPNYFQKQETPIEREMRIARERENELRRLKGLPEIVVKDDDPYSSYGASPESNPSSSVSRPRASGQPSDSMKKFASTRLQQELLQQKNRELALRSEGKIISTSEEHIEPLKYMEVAGVDKVDGREKRNFVTKKTSVSSYPEPEAPQGQQEATSPAPQPARKTSVAAGGQLFSYKEFKQTAESKIERELREMREREEELRMQRTGETPR